MRVKLLLNIGTPDAKRLGLTKRLAGEVADVTKEAGEELLRRGWGTDRFEEDRPVPRAAPVNSAGLPPTPPAGEAVPEGAAPAPAAAGNPDAAAAKKGDRR